jgi:hypothetical protein
LDRINKIYRIGEARRLAVQWHQAIREIDFGDGLKIPFRFSFNSRSESSLYGWTGFNLGAIESTAVQKSPTLYRLTLLCSKKLWFKQNPANTSEYKSNDGEWIMTIVNSTTLKAVRWDGWEMTFKNGLIDTVKTDKGRTLSWERDAAASNRVKRIYEPSTNTTALEMVYGSGNLVTGIKVNNDLYSISFDSMSLSQITFPDGRTHGFELSGTSVSHTDTFGVSTSWSWASDTKKITSEGPWTYVTGSSVPSEEDGIVYDQPKLERKRTADTTEKESVEYTAQNSIIVSKEFNGLLYMLGSSIEFQVSPGLQPKRVVWINPPDSEVAIEVAMGFERRAIPVQILWGTLRTVSPQRWKALGNRVSFREQTGIADYVRDLPILE